MGLDIDAEAEKVDDALQVIEDFTLTVSHDGEQFHADVEEGQDVGMGPPPRGSQLCSMSVGSLL